MQDSQEFINYRKIIHISRIIPSYIRLRSFLSAQYYFVLFIVGKMPTNAQKNTEKMTGKNAGKNAGKTAGKTAGKMPENTLKRIFSSESNTNRTVFRQHHLKDMFDNDTQYLKGSITKA